MAKHTFKAHHAALNSAIKSGDLAAAKTHAFNLGNALHKASGSIPESHGGSDVTSGLGTRGEDAYSSTPDVTMEPQPSDMNEPGEGQPQTPVGGSPSTFQGAAPMAPKKTGGLGNWMSGAVKHPGALHKSLGVPQGQKIPQAKIAKAANSSDPTLAKRARLAETFARFRGK